MKKLIIALDGAHFPQGAFEFANNINKQNPILLAGVFLSPVDYSKLLSFTGIEGISMLPGWLMRNEDDEVVNRNIQMFEDACVKSGIQYRVHKDNDLMAVASLVEETRFADVLLVSSDLFFNNVQDTQPNFYLEEVLKKAECPVMLIPENYAEPQQTVIAYDGSESSVFAIKMFAYNFPGLAKKSTTLLSMAAKEEVELPEQAMISELLSGHYPDLKVHKLLKAKKKQFSLWVAEQPNSFIIMGAFSRGLFSELFKKSFAADVIHDIKMPIFISHK